MRAVILDCDTVNNEDLDLGPLTQLDDVQWTIHSATEPALVVERMQDCHIVMLNKIVLDAETLSTISPTTRLIAVAATGTNNIDLEAARRYNITVCNVRGYGTASVVQHVYALILALTTQLPKYMSAVSHGDWNQHPHFCLLNYPIRELHGLNLGIIGYGTLGKGVAEIAKSFGLNVLIAQRPGGKPTPGRVPMDRLLEQVDILSLHCPLTEQTRNLIDRDRLRLMKNDALLINTARGGIINEQDLAEALKAGEIGGAGIDVLTEEPPARGNPLLDPNIPNLIVTPHTAWASRTARQRVINICAENIQAFLRGKPVNTVT